MSGGLPTVRMGDREVTITQMLTSRAEAIDKVLPEASGMTGEQLARIAHNEVLKNPDLAECNPNTIMNAVYDAARLGLLIGREAHLVPYRRVCKMLPDYRGFLTIDKRLPTTKIRGMADLIALDTQSDLGEARGAMSWDNDAQARSSLATHTAEKQAALKVQLLGSGDDDVPSEPEDVEVVEVPPVLSSTEDAADQQERAVDARLEKKETTKKNGGKKK